ncbi:MAG: tail assembly protein [Moorea sp. SIO3I7]|uniref:hypothetical protein n=1 Tax=Moorena sp. SIO3I8 TaxID=2607833 RepID=UPI0013C2223B|nr:hypothetical protein [Moorena sp. SIO3I8]NEN94488.1 tail assembly protein [Moorena sp. SIO3I7]NEO04934.1 tail assembly protein [Moorena sp. SIO3I8]
MNKTTIVLWGELGKQFTPTIEAEVSTLGEVVRCLCANFPSLKDYLVQSTCRYQVTIRRNQAEFTVDPEASRLSCIPVEGAEVVISPVVAGSGGIGRVFAGIALVGIGILTGGVGLAITGAAMALNGILGGAPDAPKPEDDDRQSLVFGGATTTTEEGNRIPVVAAHEYIVGVQIISFAIKSELNS